MQSNEQNLENVATAILRLGENGEATADAIARDLDIKEKYYGKVRDTVNDFVSGYTRKAPEISDKVFLIDKFHAYPKIWADKADMERTAEEIVDVVYNAKNARESLDEHIANGGRRESWLADKIENGAQSCGANNAGEYAGRIDAAIDKANADMQNTITNLDGSINKNPNLDGLIAERDHANTFNIDAAQKESDLRAVPLESNSKNSVDIVVKDPSGKNVQRYQSKYGKDAQTTEEYFKNGDYRGQRKLAPKGQAEDIKGANNKIECDGVESKPLSKEEAKAIQEKAQKEGKAKEYDWNDCSKFEISKQIGTKAAIAGGIAVAFQGARVVGRRIWNWLSGQENQSVEEDVKEFAESSIKSGASAGLTVAVSGGLTVAARSGWLGKILSKTPAGHIAAAASIGVEHVKTLYRFAKGEISGAQAMDEAGRATYSVVGGLVGSAKGAGIGASLGAVLGPVGAAVGGIAGGIVGGIAGSTMGEMVHSAGRAMSKVVSGTMSAAWGAAKSVGSAAWGAVKSVGSAIAGWFGR